MHEIERCAEPNGGFRKCESAKRKKTVTFFQGEEGDTEYAQHREVAQKENHARGLESFLNYVKDNYKKAQAQADAPDATGFTFDDTAEDDDDDDDGPFGGSCGGSRSDGHELISGLLDQERAGRLEQMRLEIEKADARIFEMNREIERTLADWVRLAHANDLKFKFVEEQRRQEQQGSGQCANCNEADVPLGLSFCCKQTPCYGCAREFFDEGRFWCGCPDKEKLAKGTSGDDTSNFMEPLL